MAGLLWGVAAVGVGTSAAVGAWLSWRADELRWLGHRVRDELRVLGALLERAAHRLARPQDPDDTRVSLSEVSEMIDVVNLGLSAGLSFDAALELYGASRHTLLAREMMRALLLWRIGAGTREEELTAVARRVHMKVLESFAVAVSEAIALGAPLAETLAAQGREIRAAHRAEIERAIEQAPVKLLIPTGTLILPALLLSILGPFVAASGMW